MCLEKGGLYVGSNSEVCEEKVRTQVGWRVRRPDYLKVLLNPQCKFPLRVLRGKIER